MMRIKAKTRWSFEADADEVLVLASIFAKIARPAAGFTRLTFSDEERSMIEGLDKHLNGEQDGAAVDVQ